MGCFCMRKSRCAVVLLCAAIIAPQAGAQDLQVDLDASYAAANPDYSPFETGDGVAIYGQLVYDASFMVVARYNNASFRPSGPVAGGVVEAWAEIGLGYRWDWSAAWASELVVTSQHVDNTVGSESGVQVQVGVSFRALEPLSFALHVGYLDLLISDWTLNLESKYHFNERIYAVTRLRDYADWDLTYYGIGLGLRF